jgi:hypothetical protein
MADRRASVVPAVVLVGLAGVVLAGCGGGGGAQNAEVAGRTLATRTREVGSVEVRVAPRRVGDRAAVFALSLDTHSGDLGVDLQAAATLAVDGEEWPISGFEGDGPGGHHREGTLRFRAAGSAKRRMRLIIRGMGGPVEFTWSLGSGVGG